MTLAKYENGYKYCSRCNVFVKIDGGRCPYCWGVLRLSSRRKKTVPQNKYIDAERYL